MSEFRESDIAQKIYNEAWELEKQEPSYPDNGPETLKHATYSFLQWILKDTEADSDLYGAWGYVSYHRNVINRLQNKEEWFADTHDLENEHIVEQFNEAQEVLAPYITRLEEAIGYARIEGNELFYVETYALFQFYPWVIAWITYHPERDEGEPEEDLELVTTGGYIPSRYGRQPREFKTQKEAGDYLRETYKEWASTEA